MISDKCKGRGRDENGAYLSKGTAQNAYSSQESSSPSRHSSPELREGAGIFLKAAASKATEC